MDDLKLPGAKHRFPAFRHLESISEPLQYGSTGLDPSRSLRSSFNLQEPPVLSGGLLVDSSCPH